MKSAWVAVMATLLIGAASQASADGAVAGLNSSTGSVLVNQNGHYVPLRQGTKLRAGDRLMALNGGSSDVIYPDGCKVAVGSGSLIRVSNTSPCQSGAKPQLVRLQGDADADHHDHGGMWGGNGAWELVAGAFIIGVVVLIATQHNNNGVSP